jgi:hypothetical protein
VFTARYVLSPYIQQIRFVVKGLNYITIRPMTFNNSTYISCDCLIHPADTQNCALLNGSIQNSVEGLQREMSSYRDEMCEQYRQLVSSRWFNSRQIDKAWNWIHYTPNVDCRLVGRQTCLETDTSTVTVTGLVSYRSFCSVEVYGDFCLSAANRSMLLFIARK